MLTALGPWRLRSSGAHCDPEVAKRIGETLAEKDWRDTWRGRGGGKEEEEEEEEKEEKEQTALIKSNNPHLAVAGGGKRTL